MDDEVEMNEVEESPIPVAETDDSENPAALTDEDNFGCGRLKPLADPDSMNPADKLSFRRRGQVDKLRGRVDRPPRFLPPVHLPSWPLMNLDQKLPVVKSVKGTLFYSRGRLGQKLYQPPKRYSNEDPNNMERVLAEPYNALHDPNAASFLQKPTVQEFLLNQGLITQTGQVICSVKDFNKYRLYLNSLHKDGIHGVIDDMQGQADENRKMDFELSYYMNKTENRTLERLQALAAKQREKETKRLEQIAFKQKMAEDRQFRLQLDHEQKRRNLKLKAEANDMMRKERLVNLRTLEKIMRDAMVQRLILKEEQIKERKANDKKMMEQAYRQFLLEWLDAKWETQNQKIAADEILEQSLNVRFREKAEKRQKHVENYRAAMPQIMERQKAKRERLWNIVRKYFYRWLNKVRTRRANKPDAQHQSLWDYAAVLDETVKYLQKESGYEKLDNFIMTILKLKKDIKREMELEDEAEAAAAAEIDARAAAVAAAESELSHSHEMNRRSTRKQLVAYNDDEANNSGSAKSSK